LDERPLRSTVMLNLKMDANVLVIEDILKKWRSRHSGSREGVDGASRTADVA